MNVGRSLLVTLSLLGWGCRWPVEPQPYTTVGARDQEPQHERDLGCTSEGFTLVVGPEQPCVELLGVFGRGDAHPLFRPVVHPPGGGTPVRVVRRGTAAVDVELVLGCRPFYNDAPFVDVARYAPGPSCEVQSFGTSNCGTARVTAELDTEDVLELSILGEGAAVDVRACARAAP